MKKGFFSLLFLIVLAIPLLATAKTPTLDVKVSGKTLPKGDMEDFFEKVKDSCAEDALTETKAPKAIEFACLRGTYLWGVMGSGRKVNLPNSCWLDTYAACNWDLGSANERFQGSDVQCNNHGGIDIEGGDKEELDIVTCPQFYEFLYIELATKPGITCEEIKDMATVEDYCEKILREEDTEVHEKKTGRTVDLCAQDPVARNPPPMDEELPEDLPTADCSGATQPVPESCCNGQGEMPTAEACQDACNSIPPQDVGNYPYCCDGTVTPEPAVCEVAPQSEEECGGDVVDGLCVPTQECMLFNDPDLGEQCCNVDYSDGVDSPDACRFICSSAGGRADFDWCCDGTVQPQNQWCTDPEPEPEPEPDPCDASPTDPACEPEPDPCEASPTDPACEEPACPGVVTEDGLCVPPLDCNLLTGNSADLEACCNYAWDVNSPAMCIAYCSEPGNRSTSAWCCDGTVDPTDPNCDNQPPPEPEPEPEPEDPCETDPNGEGCNLPPSYCQIPQHPEFDKEYCCGTEWSRSPNICYAYCSDPPGRDANAWCCDGSLNPPSPNCTAVKTALTQKDLNSMLKTLGVRL